MSTDPVLLVHGWPTSSFLWRNVVPPLRRAGCQPIVIDLPGYGLAPKPLDDPYGFDTFLRAIDARLAEAGVERVGLVGHDLGGPIALRWALERPGRVTALALLNTIVYPDFHPSVMEFVAALSEPASRDALTSPEGLAQVMRLGVADPEVVTDEVMAGVTAPFGSPEARQALARAGIGLEPEVFADSARRLPELDVPVRLIYGEQDRVLPDVGDTMACLAADLPQAECTALPDCGHFLQEEQPELVGDLLGAFFAGRRQPVAG